jgi:hypothetical protein
MPPFDGERGTPGAPPVLSKIDRKIERRDQLQVDEPITTTTDRNDKASEPQEFLNSSPSLGESKKQKEPSPTVPANDLQSHFDRVLSDLGCEVNGSAIKHAKFTIPYAGVQIDIANKPGFWPAALNILKSLAIDFASRSGALPEHIEAYARSIVRRASVSDAAQENILKDAIQLAKTRDGGKPQSAPVGGYSREPKKPASPAPRGMGPRKLGTAS